MPSEQATVLWAQRSSKIDPAKNIIILRIMAPDVPSGNAKLNIENNRMIFSGVSTNNDITYYAELDFYAEVEPNAKVTHTGRETKAIITKKELGEEYWKRLTKEPKVHFVRTDFDAWVDQDDQGPIINEPYEGGFPDYDDDEEELEQPDPDNQIPTSYNGQKYGEADNMPKRTPVDLEKDKEYY